MKHYFAALGLSALSLNANAATYLFEMSGEIDFVPAWASFVEVGDAWSANLRIDSTIANTSPHADPAWYPYLEGTLTFDEYSFSTGSDFTYAEGQQITIGNDSPSNPPRDSAIFFLDTWPTYPEIDGYSFLGAFISLGGPDSTWDSNDLSVLESTTYFDFDYRALTLQFVDTNGNITGAVSSFSISVVPIPAAVWMFGSALGLLAWIRRRTA